MAKLTLNDITNLSGNPGSAETNINTNSALIEVAMENTLSRDGTTPNTMSADIDMNSNSVTNLNAPTNSTDAATKSYVDSLSQGVLGFRGALVNPTGNTSLPNTTSTVVDCDAEVYDTNSIHDLVTNNSRLTVPDGVTKVKVKASIHVTGVTAAGILTTYIGKNGSGSYIGSAYQTRDQNSQAIRTSMVSSVLEVVAGDYFELITYQTSGSELSISGHANNGNTWVSMEIVE